jgi:repressor LexA
MRELTGRQKEVLSFITKHINIHLYPPTIREIAEYFEMSVKGAHDHVTALKKKGMIKQSGKRSRTMEMVNKNEEEGMEIQVEIPILGTVAAGVPILSEENRDGSITVHRSMLKKNKTYFAVRVRGNSMSGAGIVDGDIAIIEKQSVVRNGEIAVTVISEGFALKRFYRDASRIRLLSENPEFKPIYCQNARILGRLSRIIRSY